MEEIATKIQNQKKRSLKLMDEARALMKDAKQEQKKVRTRGLCIMGNRLLSILGVRDIEAHQKFFEQICADKHKVEDILFACFKQYYKERQAQAQKQAPDQEQKNV